MKKYSIWRLQDIENNINKEKFIEYLEYVLEKKGAEKVLEVLKVGGFFISYRENLRIQEEQISRINEFVKNNLERRYIREFESLRKEAEILEKRKVELRRNIDAFYRVYFIDIIKLVSIATNLIEEVNNGYLIDNYQQRASSSEYIMFSLGDLIKECITRTDRGKMGDAFISDEELRKMFTLAIVLREYKEIIQSWMFGKVSIISDSDMLYIEENEGKCFERIISALSFWDIKDIKTLKYQYELKQEFGKSYEEVYKAVLEEKVQEYFYTIDFRETYLEIELYFWIQAYTFFFRKAMNSIEKYFLIEKEVLINELSREGIPCEKAALIVESFSFGLKTKDICDSFLIPIQNKLLFAPIIFRHIDSSRAMMSKFEKANKDVEKKGIAFENHILSLIQNNRNIKVCTNLSARDGQENYQIDIVFVLDDKLFFVECKTQHQHENLREYYRNLLEIEYYIGKFKRNCNFFRNNEKGKTILSTRLKEQGVDIRTMKAQYKIYLGNLYYPFSKIEDIYITEEPSFYKYMKRIPSCAYWINGEKKKRIIYRLYPQYYEGKVCTEQYLACLENKKREIEVSGKRVKLCENILLREFKISSVRYIVNQDSNFLECLSSSEYILQEEKIIS